MNETTETIKDEDESQDRNLLEKNVWEERMDARINSRYYGFLTHKFEHFNFWLTVIFVFVSSGAFWSVVSSRPVWLSSILILVVTGASIWAHFANWQRKSTICSLIYNQCSKLEMDWNDLWLELNVVENPSEDHYRIYRELVRRSHEITAKVPEYGIYDEKLHKQHSKEIYEIVRNE